MQAIERALVYVLFDVRRVADDYVEAALREDFGKFLFPVERFFITKMNSDTLS